MGISVVNLIRKAWGYAAGGSYITTPIPDTTVAPGRASFEQGSPPSSMTAKVAGGIPPFGQDYNGILNMITNNLAGLNAGQVNVYDATFASDIGGYAKSALLGMADGTGWWINLTAANTTDPDASGAGWAPVYRYDWTTISGLVGGTRTLTNLEARSAFIVLQGVLGSNQSVEFPTGFREWTIINETTGAFTLTCKTAAGTGVVVPNGGGSNAVQIYCNNVNIYYKAQPISVPVDQGSTPLTIAQRTASGALVASSFTDLTNFVNTFGPRSIANGKPWSYTLPGGFVLRGGWDPFFSTVTTITYAVPYTAWGMAFVCGRAGSGNVQDNWPTVLAVDPTSGSAKAGFTAHNNNSGTYAYWISIGV